DTHAPVAADTAAPAGGHHVSRALALGLMLASVLVAAAGLWLARFVYVRRPGLADRLATRWPALYRWLLGKYYVDELYEATVVRATYGSARGLWRFDEGVIDGAVDGSGLATRVSAWFSHMFDKYVVDGLVNLTGWATGESSFTFRRFQTGLVQNYALLMLFGVFTLLTVYLLAR
ncbi:MAG TPA: hypothetical protein VNK92_07210, partial [Vicinamibacterales bacterium]|nr:hypothetical protein [Vicinamibacterales bacterium]